jgi:hypothetical protein
VVDAFLIVSSLKFREGAFGISVSLSSHSVLFVLFSVSLSTFLNSHVRVVFSQLLFCISTDTVFFLTGTPKTGLAMSAAPGENKCSKYQPTNPFKALFSSVRFSGALMRINVVLSLRQQVLKRVLKPQST